MYANDVLLQLLFALMPFVLFNIYYRDRAVTYSKRFINLTCTVCLLLSMTFPSSVQDGFIFDIRYVIMFFGMVFGGMATGLILLAEFLVYRILLGGDGLLPALVIVAITYPASVLLSILYCRSDHRKWISFAAGIVFSAIPMGVLLVLERPYMLKHLSYHLLIIPVQNCLGIWLLLTLFHKAISDKELYLNYLQNEKVETIGHVAASLAHEVRNPLTAVMGFLKLIRDGSVPKEKIRYFIDISLDEIKRTEAILSEYLSVSKPALQSRERIELGLQLDSVIDIMTPYANMNNVTIERLQAETEIRIAANPNEIKQLLINFIKNGIEACANVSKGKVSIHLDRDNHHARIAIHDNGVGMSQGQLKRLGTIYFSTKNNGTGLGLTVSYQLIRSMNGTVSVRSEPGEGTKFVISLPVSD
ncbi:GHKL domain-containing protein [Cohnella sp. CFH 77786]|nr:GHKL domain-containing protein [Cohnella sp. CFH 77786]